MKERAKSIRFPRLLWSLALGLGLVLGLFWGLTPHSTVEAQAVIAQDIEPNGGSFHHDIERLLDMRSSNNVAVNYEEPGGGGRHGGATAARPDLLRAPGDVVTITILHTNDFHGNLEPDYAGRGGSAHMADVIDDIRATEGEENVLLVDAGDMFFRAPPISQLLLGESAIDVYNLPGYDVAAVGEHEFDKGQTVLISRITQSSFPWIGANIVISGTAWDHPTWTLPYVTVTVGTTGSQVTLGVIGLATDETPQITPSGTTAGLEFKDPTESILHYYDEVLTQSDAVIVLAHVGIQDRGSYKGLQTVAQELIDAEKPVDLIIGGQQHQALYSPVWVEDTAIVEAGLSGRWLGRADVSIDTETKELTLVNYELITISDALSAGPTVEARVAYWADQVASYLAQAVGTTNISLTRDYNNESIMGDLVTDGMLWKADLLDDAALNGTVEIAFTNPGGLRADIEVTSTLPYTITYDETFDVMPFGNTLFLMDLTGAQIQELLDQAATLYKGILQTSGASWYWYNDCDCNTPSAWGAYNIEVDGQPLSPTQVYRVVTNNFLAAGQDGWVTFADGTNRWDTYYDMQEAVNDYIGTISPIDSGDIPGGRITQVSQDVSIEKWTTPGVARPGGTYLYGIRYRNNGNDTAENTIITDTLPLSTTYSADSSGLPVTDGGSVITWTLGDVAAGTEAEFYVALNVDSGVPTQTNLAPNCAGIATISPADYDLSNNWACSGEVWVDESDAGVGVNKWPGPGDPHSGQEFVYYIDYWSDGSGASGPVWLTDTLPVSTTFVSWDEEWGWGELWTEVVTTGGQFVLHAPAGIPGDMSGRIRLRLLLNGAAEISTTLYNHVVITTTGDIDPRNNWDDEDVHVSSARYDMNTDKWHNNGVLVPGGWVNYGVNYWNAGNIATQAWITDVLPPGTSYQPGSGWDHDGQPFPPAIVTGDYVVWDLGLVAVTDGFGFNFTLDVSDTVSPGTVFTNCVTVGITETEDTPWDNTACVAESINVPGPNLRVTKGHDWHGDGQLGYQVRFENIGDETVSDVWITDTLPLSTAWDGWWDMGFDWGRLVSDTQSSSVLRWNFSELYPGDSGWLWFNTNLDEPGVPLRWYTNTVEIDTPPDDVSPDDNEDIDVAFSGGEVEWVDLDVYGNNLWGCVPQLPITITTAYRQRVIDWDTCFNEWFDEPFQPGEVVTVAAGSGTLPVVIEIPDPFTARASSITDTVWGQIDALDHEQINVDLDDGPDLDVQTDGSGNYSATFSDVPRGGHGWVNYETEIAYAEIDFHRRFQAPDLVTTVDYRDDWVNGNYEPGHSVWITDTESDGSTIKAKAELTTGPIPWWGGQSGFETQWYDWSPSQPDIEPGDWVYGLVNSESYTATVRVGAINGEVDVDNDTVSGTIDASWLAPDPIAVNCEIHEENGPGIRVDNVDPDGGSFFCDFGGQWDIEPGHNVAVNYTEPDGDQVQTHPANPAPYLGINKWAEGNPGEGGNLAFRVQYQNQGGDDAEDVVITDTLQGMTYITDTSGLPHTGSGTPADPLIWHVGTLPANSSDEFYVFAEITAVESDTITNTVQIATSDPYDQGDPGEKESWWSGHVEANDTHLNVGKYAWTGDPAPDTDFVYAVNVCNNGSTGSSEVVLTDTLHPSTTLQTWWGQHPGWTEVLSTSDQLVVSRPSIPGWWCSEVYLRVHLDAAAWSGMSISDTAVITASNDMEDDDNETTWWGNVGDPHVNLYINKNWGNGQLVPGGQLNYNVDFGNGGNVPVASTVRVTDTLPESTTFNQAWLHDNQWMIFPITPTVVTEEYVVWEVDGIDNGYNVGFGVQLNVAYDADPGTVLTNTAEISPQPSEDDYDDNVATAVETLYEHGPNLRIRKDGGWSDWGENTRQTWYNLAVENIGDATVMPVVITDTYDSKMYLDGGVGVNYWRGWDWRDDPADHTFTVTLEVLYPGEQIDVNFGTITDTEPLPFGLVFTNTAEVMLDPNDAKLADNTDEVLLTTGPDLYVEKTLMGGDLLPGELITFSLAFGNDHEGHEWWWNMQGDARLTDILPDALEYVDSTPSPDLHVGSTFMWLLWPINAGERSEIYLTVRITDTAEGDDVFTNQVEIESDQPSNDVEPYYDNNENSYDVAIALPYFEVGKLYQSNEVAGMPITYTLTVTNVGNYPGTAVVLSDTVPAFLENVDGDYDSFDGVDATWAFDNISPFGGMATGRFSATLPCTAGLSIVNDTYLVVSSAEGVSSPLGAEVRFDVLVPAVSAGFTYTSGTILAADTVSFTNISTSDGTGLSYTWDFGDGSAPATAQDASHAYARHGSYTVVLTATDTCGYSDAVTTTVVVGPRFGIAKTWAGNGVAGTAVTYTLTVTNLGSTAATVTVSDTVPAYLSDHSGTAGFPYVEWQLGPIAPDGGTATGEFNATITCTAGLDIVNDDYGVRWSDTGAVGPEGDPVSFNVSAPTIGAALAHTPATIVVGDPVLFTATVDTDGTDLSYAWDLGTGPTSGGLTATHVYTRDDVYTIAFTATDACNYSEVATTTITVNAPNLVADFDYKPRPANILVDGTVIFTDTSTTDGPPIVAWAWNFGDDSAPALAQNAAHIYEAAGTYTVTLVVTDVLGYSDSKIETNVVTVTLACTPVTSVTFTYAPLDLVIQSPVTFTAAIAPSNATAPITYTWDFGDGYVGNDQVVSHSYALSDTYDVVVTATNCTGAGIATYTENVAATLVDGAQTLVDPIMGGTLIYTDAQGNPTTVQVPGGATTGTVTLLFTPVALPTQPVSPSLRFINHTFDLEAYMDNHLVSGYVFSKPVTITVQYSDADVAGVDEGNLRLHYWTGSAWDDVVNTCTPPSTYTRDLVQNLLGVPICHLSRYSVLGESLNTIYLPVVLRES